MAEAREKLMEVCSEFKTPRGNSAWAWYRLNTNDWNTITSAMTEDEYHLADLPLLSGHAVDIGAHIGSVGIGLAIDNPDLTVLCIEPVPDNVEMLQRNIEANGLTNVTVLGAAAGGPDDKTTTVDWGYTGQPALEHHAYIGNTALVHEFGSNPHFPHKETTAECYSISRLLAHLGIERLSLLKIDCEGCEWGVLSDPATDRIDIILGEWHSVTPRCLPGQTPNQGMLVERLPNHYVTFSGPERGPGGFHAVHR